MKNIALISILASFPLLTLAQSGKKQLKENKVRSKTERKFSYSDGVEKSYKSSEEKYDKNGNITEMTEYKPDGSVKTKKSFTYNDNGKKTEEISYESGGAVNEKTTFVYEGKGKGKLSEEMVYDSKGILLKKSVYKYDGKGMKTETNTYDGGGKIQSKKTFTYGY